MNKFSKQVLLACSLSAVCIVDPMQSEARSDLWYVMQHDVTPQIKAVQKINPTTVEVVFTDHSRMTFDFYGDHIFRLFQDNNGGILRDPDSKPAAQILVDNPRKMVTTLAVSNDGAKAKIETPAVRIELTKEGGMLSITNLKTGVKVVEMTAPIHFEKAKVAMTLKEEPMEYFYGGGVQNGRFSHKGKVIAIENQNSWTDGGVASPTPFYWSTSGYGMMWYTFKKGKYDFGANKKGEVKLYHEESYLDVFFMVNDGAVSLLNDFYQLTGNPVLMPKFGFYQGHLNAYNRDYWKQDEKGILYEDGKKYKESQKDDTGIKESLNGEKDNYQFSARAVIDRYRKYDMPLGWILPNDGYGAGYGQTETLDGNIQNLKDFGDYARKNGVEIGLWTQSDLHPKEGVSALLQRDIVKEVRDAGVRVLKTDVAWVGPGYSFGLNGIADVGHIMPYYGNNARPFIISLDGWAGTQRYAGIWSGDQTGGVWEYIRFHIPTYIGSGLSGQPNISSDMDGIFGGKNVPVNVRDFQWKTFTPMQLNMDGWGSNPKYPQALGDTAMSINRNYLKLKSELMPYAYSIAKESVDGLPMIRAMFLEYPNTYTMGKSTQYQFMYGPSLLVAPIYQATKSDSQGNDVRNGIYLPEGNWIDYFSGSQYAGNRILNSFDAPLWKLPVFVKAGAIIPLANANNNVHEINNQQRVFEIYPSDSSSFVLYDDDGNTQAYRSGKGATTYITSDVKGNKVVVNVAPTMGSFDGMQSQKSTFFVVNVTEKPKSLHVVVGKKKIKLREVTSREEYEKSENVYFYEEQPNLNRFSTSGTALASLLIRKTPQLHVHIEQTDIVQNNVRLDIQGFVFNPIDPLKTKEGTVQAPANFKVMEGNIQAYTLKPTWDLVSNADYYEIEFNDVLYTTIRDTALLFQDLQPVTDYVFKIRSVNKSGASDWQSIQARTKSNPLEFAITGIVGEATAENQGGYSIQKLFDYDEGNIWHTKWGMKSVPFDMVLDLKSFNQLDKIHYLPRTDGGNGILTRGKVYYSSNKEDWAAAGTFEWNRNGDIKVFTFDTRPTARYIKIAVEDGAGGFGSGREMYVFKVPGTESYLPGDINADHLLDVNDLTSYRNYTGLRAGDSDFEGYISNGDINKNGLIDAYDVSVLTTQLDGGAKANKGDHVAGKIELVSSKTQANAGEVVEITVKGKDLKYVNALSFGLPYNATEFDFVAVQPLNMKQMDNLTNDRLHTNRTKSLYPTFVNIGDQEVVSGSVDLFVIKLKAKKYVKISTKVIDGFLVDKSLNTVKF